MPPGVLLPALAAALLASAAAHAAGDPARGERVLRQCYACHSVDPDEKTMLQGPNLAGIVGRSIATEAGFAYSGAMRAFAAQFGVWSEQLLDRYMADPERLVPKTTMAARGVEEAEERADLLAFLKRPVPGPDKP